jgi:hypothetical protein
LAATEPTRTVSVVKVETCILEKILKLSLRREASVKGGLLEYLLIAELELTSEFLSLLLGNDVNHRHMAHIQLNGRETSRRKSGLPLTIIPCRQGRLRLVGLTD